MDIVESPEEFSFKCGVCGLKFKNIKYGHSHWLESHTLSIKETGRGVSSKPPPQYQCRDTKCKKTFKHAKSRVAHELVKHLRVVYPCATCRKSYSTLRKHDNHHNLAHENCHCRSCRRIEYDYYKCTECSKLFKHIPALDKHEQEHQSDVTDENSTSHHPYSFSEVTSENVVIEQDLFNSIENLDTTNFSPDVDVLFNLEEFNLEEFVFSEGEILFPDY